MAARYRRMVKEKFRIELVLSLSVPLPVTAGLRTASYELI